MEVHSLKCKECGAPLAIKKNATLATCNYCGSHFGIKHPDEQPDVIILEPVEKPPVVRAKDASPKRAIPVARPKPREDESLEAIRFGANVLDAVVGFRGCLNTGFVLTILGFFVICGLCGLSRFFQGVSESVQKAATAPIRARSDGTDRVLDNAARTIVGYSGVNDALPDSGLGNQLVNRYHDEWGRPLRYEQDTASDFVVRSAGPDGQFDTPDDLTEREHSSRVRDTSRVAQPPQDLASAISYLATPGRFQKRAACVWLLAETPELNDEQREQVVAAAISLLQDRGSREQAQSVLHRWADESDAGSLSKAGERANPRDEQHVDAIVLQLIRIEAKDGVLKFLNHPSTSVRASVAVAMSDWNVPAATLIQQSVKDLSDQTKQAAALNRLKTAELDDQQRSHVASAVKLLLLDSDTRRIMNLSAAGVAALNILEQAGEVDVPLLVKVYTNNASPFVRDTSLRNRAGELLVKNPEPSVCLHFAEQLANHHDESATHAERLLEEIGPAAEAYVWPTLLGDDREAAARACAVLAEIGTAKSIPYLEQASLNSPVASEAAAAVLKIRAAQRQPVELTSDPNQ